MINSEIRFLQNEINCVKNEINTKSSLNLVGNMVEMFDKQTGVVLTSTQQIA